MQLASIRPQTPQIQKREEGLMNLVQTYIVSINVVFKYKKSSTPIFIVYSFNYVIK